MGTMSEEPLPPREAAKFIAEHSQDVTIVQEGVSSTAKKLFSLMKEDPSTLHVDRWKLHDLNPKTADRAAADWVFVSDVLNFSFWSDDEHHKYMVRHGGQEWTGYWSLCAAINRALDEGIPLTSPTYYATMSMEQLKVAFRSDSDTAMPLMEDRLKCLHQAGQVLMQKYGGSFVGMLEQCDGSAVKLVEMVVRDIPSFRDVCSFHGKKVALYKRAQILVADTWAACGGCGLGAFSDIHQLTMFADYRIPQALVWFGAMKHSDRLLEHLKKDTLMQNGDREEVEIRGCSIWTVEMIVCELRKLIASDPEVPSDTTINAVLVDHFMWDYRRQHQADTQNVPYHKGNEWETTSGETTEGIRCDLDPHSRSQQPLDK